MPFKTLEDELAYENSAIQKPQTLEEELNIANKGLTGFTPIGGTTPPPESVLPTQSPTPKTESVTNYRKQALDFMDKLPNVVDIAALPITAVSRTLKETGIAPEVGTGIEDAVGTFKKNIADPIGRGAYRGIVSVLPEQLGAAGEFLNIPGGKELKEWGKSGFEEKPKYELKVGDTDLSAIPNTIYEGAEMLAPSIIPGGVLTKMAAWLPKVSNLFKLANAAKVAGDTVKAEELARKAMNFASNVGSSGAAGIFGLSQAQQTTDIAKERGVEPGIAPYITGLIEGVGEFFGTKYLGKLLRVNEDVADGLIKSKRNAWLEFLKTLGVEVGTEMGQSGGEAYVEKKAGIRPNADPLQEAIGAIGPTVVMTVLTGGLSGIASKPKTAKDTDISPKIDLMNEPKETPPPPSGAFTSDKGIIPDVIPGEISKEDMRKFQTAKEKELGISNIDVLPINLMKPRVERPEGLKDAFDIENYPLEQQKKQEQIKKPIGTVEPSNDDFWGTFGQGLTVEPKTAVTIKTLADKIVSGAKEYTQEELQLQNNFPNELETELKTRAEKQSLDSRQDQLEKTKINAIDIDATKNLLDKNKSTTEHLAEAKTIEELANKAKMIEESLDIELAQTTDPIKQAGIVRQKSNLREDVSKATDVLFENATTTPPAEEPIERETEQTPVSLLDKSYAAFNEEWHEKQFQIQAMKDKVQPEIDRLKKEYSALKGRGVKDKKTEIQKKIDNLLLPISNAEAGIENEITKAQGNLSKKIYEYAKSRGITDEDTLADIEESVMLAFDTRYLEGRKDWNKVTPQQLLDEAIEEHLPHQAGTKEPERAEPQKQEPITPETKLSPEAKVVPETKPVKTENVQKAQGKLPNEDFIKKVKESEDNTNRLIKEGNYTIAKQQPRSEKGEAHLAKLGYIPLLWDEKTNTLIKHPLGTWVKKIAEKPVSQSPSVSISSFVTDKLSKGEKITKTDLIKQSDEAFGGTRAEGKYTSKDMFDALEMGINKYVMEREGVFDPSLVSTPEATRASINDIRKEIIENIPSQFGLRSGEQQEFQQFSTPPDLAFTMNWIANIQKDDTMLEPSAGIGGIATFAKIAGAKTIVNEFSERRAGLLKEMGFDKVFTENAEQLNNVLPDDVKPTVIVMNPPFSSTAGRMEGQKSSKNLIMHLDQSLARLEPNGRLVALIGKGKFKDAKAITDWFDKVQQEYNLRAIVEVSGKGYAKYGTTYDNRIIVVDKTSPQGENIVKGRVEDVKDAIPLLEGIRNDRQSNVPESTASEQAGKEVSGKGRKPGQVSTERVSTHDLGVEGRAETRRNKGLQPVSGITGKTSERTKPEGRTELPAETGRVEGLSGERVEERGEPTGGSTVVAGRTGNESEGRPETGGNLLVEEKTETPSKKSELTDSIYEPYKPQRVEIKGAQPHPGKLVQTAAMASVLPPKPTYTPSITQEQIAKMKKKPSDAQIEAVIYAGQAHSKVLPSKERKGFFVGDGTGVGKGIENSLIIHDNFNQGRKKAVWVTENSALFKDATRDWTDTGGDAKLMIDLNKKKLGDKIGDKEGVLMTTYATLRSGMDVGPAGKLQGKKDKGNRLEQITTWLGKDFDGVVIFDEAHNMRNSISVEGKRGLKKPSSQALSGIELQQRLPNARIVYVSATGATEVENLAYAERLGLWGKGTPFADKKDFIVKIGSGGIAGMEIVARDLKALGGYISRNLSYEDVTYDRLEHNLTEVQQDIYNKLAEAWQVVLKNLNDVLEKTKQGKDGKAKSFATSRFWSSQQRFFNQVITSMQMPSVIENANRQLKEGSSIVMQLVNTNEAVQNRKLAQMDEESELEDLDLTPKEVLIDYVKTGFPIYQYEERTDDNGNKYYTKVLDSKGEPVVNKEAVAIRDRLIKEVGGVKVPQGPLEIIMDEFGTDNVAEITGRTRRVVKDKAGKKIEEHWSKAKVAKDSDAFMAGKKRVLVFSDAGSTGRSFHADLTKENQQKRIHYLVQPGWRADKAVQGMGRTHRTNEASAPQYILVTTDLKGQKRFISSIARRLDQLGALTKGQRQAGSQGLFSAKDNLESKYASDALYRLFYDLYNNEAKGLDFDKVTAAMGITNLKDEKTGALNVKNLPDVPKFLNRILALPIDFQNQVFDAFHERMSQNIDRAVADGTLDYGLENYKAEGIKKLKDQTIHADKETGAEARHIEFEAKHKLKTLSFEDADTMRSKADRTGYKAGFFRNKKSGKIWMIRGIGTKTKADGRVVDEYLSVGPLNQHRYIDESQFNDNNVGKEDWQHWEKVKAGDVKKWWGDEVEKAPKFETESVHLVTGTILPIWDRLSTASTRIYRLQTDDGERYLGKLIPKSELAATLKKIGVSTSTQKISPKQAVEKVMGGSTITLANDWVIKKRTVSGDPRIELIGDDVWRFERELENAGVISEMIGYDTRFFIPTGDKAESILKDIIANRPIVDVSGAFESDTPAFSRDVNINPEEESSTTFSRESNLFNLYETTEDMTLKEDLGRVMDAMAEGMPMEEALSRYGTKATEEALTKTGEETTMESEGKHDEGTAVTTGREESAYGSVSGHMAEAEQQEAVKAYERWVRATYPRIQEGDFRPISQKNVALRQTRRTVEALNLLAQTFGKNLVFVDNKSSFQFDASFSQDGKTVFIDWKSKQPFVSLFNHELAHLLAKDHPDLWKKFKAVLIEEAEKSGNFPEWKARIDRAYERTVSGDFALQELAGEFLGKEAQNPSFWRKLRDNSPELFRKIFDIATKLINDVKVVFRGNVKIERYIKDLDKVRDAATQVMAEYARRSEFEKFSGGFEFKDLGFSKGKADTFYSQLEKTIEEKMPNRMSAEQLRNMLTGKVKEDEIKWTGLDDYLKENLNPTKQEVLDFIRQNRVEIKEVTKESIKSGADELYIEEGEPDEEGNSLYYVYDRTEPMDMPIRDFTSREDAEYFIGKAQTEGTKFHQYQTPGGENYRELLLTLPGLDTFTNPYRSSHWEEKNVIAHVRMNDRVDAEGKRVLFIEEIQSDWHQEGKRKGYKSVVTKEDAKKDGYSVYKAKSNLGSEAYFLEGPDTDRRLTNIGFDTEEDAWKGLLKHLQSKSDERVPSAPFSKTWHELALKRMLRYATENGYDKIAWTTGEMQAERYDLSKQVDLIRWIPPVAFPEGSGILQAWRDGSLVIAQETPSSKIADYIGKDAADKLLKANDTTAPNIGRPVKEISGLDLKVGGEGMKGFYDKIIPDFLNKYAKKWGARVGETEINNKPIWTVTTPDGRSLDMNTKKAADDLAKAQGGWVEETVSGGEFVPSLDITPSMKESVLYEGQPMFSKDTPLEEHKGIKTKIEQSKKMFASLRALGHLPNQKEYLGERYQTLGKIGAVDKLTHNIYSIMSKATPEDSKAIYEYLTNKDGLLSAIEDDKQRKNAEEVKSLIMEIGDSLAGKGVLSQETIEKRKGEYLPRVYLRHILGQDLFSALGTGRKPSKMGYTMKRNEDLPEEIRRIILHEVKDPAYLVSRAISVPMRDMAILDWLETISENKEWVLPKSLVEWEFAGSTKKVTPFFLKSEAQRIREQSRYITDNKTKIESLEVADKMDEAADEATTEFDQKDFRQVPNIKRYGALRGMIVRKEIYNDIVGATHITTGNESIAEQWLGHGGKITKLTQLWKWSKVAANPPAQVRNFVSNAVLLHLSGVPFHKVPLRMVQAIKEIKNNGQYWKVAQKYGVTKASFSAEEMNRINRELIDLEARSGGKFSWAYLKNLAGKTMDKTSYVYQLMESIGKTAKIIDEMKKGTPEKEAALMAHEALFDYSLIPPSVRYLRNAPVGIPFLTFNFKVLPLLVNTAIKHPLRFAPYVALTYGLTALVARMAGVDDDDLEALKKALPEWLQEKKHAYFLPFKDARGRWQAVDLGYFFPWTALLEVGSEAGKGEFGKAMQSLGVFGGPLPDLITAIQTGKDPFTKKEIFSKYDTPAEQAASIMGYLYNLSMPTWLTNIGAAGKLHDALTVKVDKYGEPKTTIGQALARFAGINTYGVEPERTRAENLKRMHNEIVALKRRMTIELRDRNNTIEDRKKIRDKYIEMIRTQNKERIKYAQESRINPKLR